MAIKLEFELLAEPGPAVSSTSRGHVTITGPGVSVSSKERQPDQSMMVLPTVVEVLDGTRRFLGKRPPAEYRFVGVDSSFQVLFSRQRGGRSLLKHQAVVIDDVSDRDLIKAIWEGATQFADRYERLIPPDDPILEDLRSSIREFRRRFKL